MLQEFNFYMQNKIKDVLWGCSSYLLECFFYVFRVLDQILNSKEEVASVARLFTNHNPKQTVP